eukprot:EG_transcript_1035
MPAVEVPKPKRPGPVARGGASSPPVYRLSPPAATTRSLRPVSTVDGSASTRASHGYGLRASLGRGGGGYIGSRMAGASKVSNTSSSSDDPSSGSDSVPQRRPTTALEDIVQSSQSTVSLLMSHLEEVKAQLAEESNARAVDRRRHEAEVRELLKAKDEVQERLRTLTRKGQKESTTGVPAGSGEELGAMLEELRAQKRVLAERLAAAEEREDDIRAQHTALCREHERGQAREAQLKQLVDDYEADLAELRDQVQEAGADVHAVKAQGTAADQLAAALRQEIAQLRGELESTNTVLVERTLQLEQREDVVVDQAAKLRQLEAELQEQERVAAQRMDEWQQMLESEVAPDAGHWRREAEAAAKQGREARSQLRALEARLEESEGARHRLVEASIAAEEELRALRRHQRETEERVEPRHELSPMAKARLEDTEKDLQRHREDAEHLREQLRLRMEECRRLRGEVDGLEQAALDKEQGFLAKLRDASADFRQKQLEAKREIEDLQSRLDRQSNERDSTAVERERQRAEEVAALTSTLRERDRAVGELEEELREAQIAVKEREAELRARSIEVRDRDREMGDLERVLEEQTQELLAQRLGAQQAQEAEAARQRLAAEVRDLQRRLGQAEAAADRAALAEQALAEKSAELSAVQGRLAGAAQKARTHLDTALEAERRCAMATEELEAVQKGCAAKVEQLKEQLGEKVREAAVAQQELLQLHTAMKTLDGELNLMTRAMEQEQRQNASLNKQVGKLQETVRMLEEGRKAESSSRIKGLEAQLTQSQEELKLKTSRLREAEDYIRTSKAKEREAAAQAQDIQERLADALRQAEELREANRALRAVETQAAGERRRNQLLEDKAGRMAGDIDALKKELRVAQEGARDKDAQSAARQNEKRLLEAERQKNTALREELQQKSAQLERTADARAEAADLSAQLRHAEEALESERRMRERDGKEVQVVRREVDRLKQCLAERDSRNAELRDKVQALAKELQQGGAAGGDSERRRLLAQVVQLEAEKNAAIAQLDRLTTVATELECRAREVEVLEEEVLRLREWKSVREALFMEDNQASRALISGQAYDRAPRHEHSSASSESPGSLGSTSSHQLLQEGRAAESQLTHPISQQTLQRMQKWEQEDRRHRQEQQAERQARQLRREAFMARRGVTETSFASSGSGPWRHDHRAA